MRGKGGHGEKGDRGGEIEGEYGGEENEMRNRGGVREGTGREKIRGRGNGRGIYTVPFALRFGHYDLVGIRLTALVVDNATKIRIFFK